jgi:hypothetical protein
VTEPRPGGPKASDKRLFFAIVGGTGLGYSSGNGEATRTEVSSAGVGWTHSGQVAPELGYFVTPQLMLGVQMRLQLLRGATPYRPESPGEGECGNETPRVCDPASGAIAALLKLTYFLTDPSSVFQPYLSLSAGAGNIRNVSSVKISRCGSGTEACVDTVVGGPVLVGPGFGFRLVVADGVGIVAGVNGLVGVPTFAATADVNLGLAFQL